MATWGSAANWLSWPRTSMARTDPLQGLPGTATLQMLRLPFASDVKYTASAAWLKIGCGCESCELQLEP